ncbi:hypothetical protein PGT21_002605 [Puccinia graminis f. sp. tritici]|uniref:Uncharacterized protein n=1 Tax=Puccinia graminis f. sp. tritici TaxID=56615 RepID=A0A5B0LLE6_PUCGR|nr:hypothetical protein PGT21_002605 [Puccinia graminis f. sp. tritici]
MMKDRRGQPVFLSHLYCALFVYGALLILTITTPTKVFSAKLSKGTFIRSNLVGNGCTFEGGSNMIRENKLNYIKPGKKDVIQSQFSRKNNSPPRISRPIGYVTLREYFTLSLHDGKTTPDKMNAFLDYLLEKNWKTIADCWKEEFQKTKIDSRELASLQLNWLKENVKENTHAKKLNAGKTVDDLLGKSSRIFLDKSIPVVSIRRYGKYMKDIMAVDQSTMNEFINSYVKNKWKEIFQDTKILKLSDIIHIHIEWAKMNDEKSLYVLMLKNPGQELETVSKIMERNLKKLELYHIIESVLENDRKLECSIEEIGFFILNQGGNAAEDSTSTAWNLEKVKRMFEEWKDYKAKNKIESSHSMILRKQFNILLPRVFGINTNLVQTLKREIGDHGQIWYQKHPWGPKFYLLPNLISTHLDWLQNNDQMSFLTLYPL